MDNFLASYIHNRMKQLGYSSYSMEPLRVKESSSTKMLLLHNEYYYLVSKSVPGDLLIESDTDIFNEGDDYNNFRYYGIREFSGQVEISQGEVPIDLEFVRVVPEISKQWRKQEE